MPNASGGGNIYSSAQINAGVIQASDIGTDQVNSTHIATNSIGTAEIADGVVTNADLNASAGIVDTKLATISTAGKVSGAALTSLSSIPAGAGTIPAVNLPGGAETFTIPQPISPQNGVSTRALNNNVDAWAYAFKITKEITVNKISLNVTAVGTSGTINVGIFSEDGQTRHISVVSGTISGVGIETIAVSAVLLPVGTYYFVAGPVSTASITFSSWLDIGTISALDVVTSEPRLSGQLVVTASTMPATFSTADSGTFQDSTNTNLVFRLDN